jgi:hypothetical protein
MNGEWAHLISEASGTGDDDDTGFLLFFKGTPLHLQ